MKTTRLTGEATSAVDRKAKYGKRDWIRWRDKSGILQADLFTEDNVREAMNAMGTQGRFTLIHAKSGIHEVVKWRMGMNFLYWLKNSQPLLDK
jgi:hypothetical protein